MSGKQKVYIIAEHTDTFLSESEAIRALCKEWCRGDEV